MIFFFGSGWVEGTADQFYPQAEYFAKRGAVTFCPDYRTSNKHGTSPFECVKDAKSAIRWVRANAADLKIDPEKIIAAGGSAGGHIAACAAIIEGFEEDGEDLNISSVPNAMVLFNPVLDTTEKGYGAHLLKDRAEEISPVHHIKKSLPPCIIFHGTADNDVPFESAQRFAGFMKKAANLCQLVPYKGKEHGFYNYGVENNVDFEKTLLAADDFLFFLGYLNPRP